MRIAAVILLLWKVGVSLTAPPPTTVIVVPNGAVQVGSVSSDREAWARALLTRLGNVQPTVPTVRFVVAWTVAEDACQVDCGYSSAFERHNPLNTTQEGFNTQTVINNDGVKGYATEEDGLAATVQTLSYGYYTEIVAGLQSNDPERALQGLYQSPWGTSASAVERLWRQG